MKRLFASIVILLSLSVAFAADKGGNENGKDEKERSEEHTSELQSR